MLRKCEEVETSSVEEASTSVEQSDPEPNSFQAPSLANPSRPKTAHVDVEPSSHHAGRHTNRLRKLVAGRKPAHMYLPQNLLDSVGDEPDHQDRSYVFVAKSFDPNQLRLDLADLYDQDMSLNSVHFRSIEDFVEFLHADQAWAATNGTTLSFLLYRRY